MVRERAVGDSPEGAQGGVNRGVPVSLATTRWDPRLDTRGAILAYLTAAFEDGDPDLVAAALQDVARAQGVVLPQERGLGNMVEALRSAGVGLAAKAA
jgi:hypothetical protein